MKNLRLLLILVRSMQVLLTPAFLLGTFVITTAQTYEIALSGAQSSPPNASPGIGSVTITIDTTSMRVQASFSGLQGTTTAAHIHAVTATAGEGTAGVATTTPSFPGFPAGVSSGTYDMTFDMTQTSSYNASFITANGGTTASAFAVLKAALDAGKAYFNIHTTQYGGGEIRGFTPPPSYQILSSMLMFNKITDAIANAIPGDTIQQINDASEKAPIELPIGYTFNFLSPFTFTVDLPTF